MIYKEEIRDSYPSIIISDIYKEETKQIIKLREDDDYMSIDEAIEQFKYDAECNRADLDLSYAEDNEQVAKWLEELKAYREIGTVKGYENAIKCYTDEYTRRKSNEQYDKAIDDFADEFISLCDDGEFMARLNEFPATAILEMAEQLKRRVCL